MNTNFWLELYIGREINQEQFDHFFHPNGQSNEEYIHYCNFEYGPNYTNLYVRLDNNRRVVYATYYKNLMQDPSHGKVTTPEKLLTSFEKKYAKNIFDLCLIDQAKNEIDDILNASVAQRASYNNFIIIRKNNAGLCYLDPSGKQKTLSRDRVLQALDYSHVQLSILRIPSEAEAFSSYFSKMPFEPLYAVLQMVDPTSYSNYLLLEKEYRFDRLKKAIAERDFANIDVFADSMIGNENELPLIFDKPCETCNLDLLKHLYTYASKLDFSLNRALDQSLYYGFRDGAVFLLQQRQCYYDLKEDSYYLRSLTTVAYRNNDLELLLLLLRKGFPFINMALDFLQGLSFDDYPHYLPLNIKIDRPIVENVCKARRFDLLNLIECQADKWISKYDISISSDILMEEYAAFDMEDRFINGIKRGFQYRSCDLFVRCFDIGQKWTNILINEGVDIDNNAGKLLRMACQSCHFELAKYLIDHGADVHITDQYFCIFEIAAQALKKNSFNTLKSKENLERICKLLLENGVDIEEAVHVNRDRETSMQLLLTEGSAEMKKYVVDWLANKNRINTPDQNKHLPVSYVVGQYARDVEILQYFIQHGALMDAAGITNDKLLYSTINYRHYDMIPLMVENGANIYETSAYSGSCMDLLIAADKADMCRVFLTHGYDISLKNQQGFTPLEYAIKHSSFRCIELFHACC